MSRLGFVPHEGQKAVLPAIIDENIREIDLACGRRWGKTLLMAYTGIREIIIPERNVWVVAPTSDLTQAVFVEIVKFIGKLYEAGEYSITSKPYMKLTMANGSYIECRTAENPTSLIGREVDLLIIDEAARISPTVYEQELAATTMTRKGKTIKISSPKGRSNWFYHDFERVKANDNGFVWNAPSSDNPLNTLEEIERLRKMLPVAIFNQEYLATFELSGTEVFRGITDIINSDCYEIAKPEHRYILGVDLAKFNDWTVLTVIDKQTHKVVFWDRFNKINYPFQKDRIVSTSRRFNNAKIIIDSTGVGNPITDDIKRENLMVDDYRFTNKSKLELVQKLSLFIEEKAIFIPNEQVLIDELNNFGMDVTTSGNLVYSAPQGMHDDCVYSLALAVWGLFQRNPQKEAREYIPAELRIKKKPPKRIHR
jgi:hypothetical protein